VAPRVFGTAKHSIEQTPVMARGHLGGEKYNSLIRQYERNHEIYDSQGKLKSQKDFMIFDESVQLPAFPKKITRNAFERSYMKRIINVKMNEFSPMNTAHKNLFQNDSFLLSNSYSGGFGHNASGDNSLQQDAVGAPMSMFPNELSIISPVEGVGYVPHSDRLIEDSLYKPSGKDLTLLPDTTQPSTHHQNVSPSLFGISLQKTSMMQGSKE
jgi:hypothetical protein